ncbi:hypothetical protein, partial [Aliarcobacter butzleri]|uniref:hypothetical protein n=1 Tax=Aliarcobacter butzleri TaxID=28197 RepID=UPI0018A0492D
EDFTNKLKLNAKDFDLTVNKFTNKGEIFGIKFYFEDFTNKLKLNAKDFDLTVNKFTNKGEIFGIKFY